MDKEYRTRDGRKVRLLCVDGPFDDYPVVGFIEGSVDSHKWRSNGRCLLASVSPGDLIKAKPRVTKTVWINHYADGGRTSWNNESDAKHFSTLTTIARTKHEIDVEHGHGLGDANE